MGWGEEGEDYGGYVVTAVEHALAELSYGVGVVWSSPGVFGEGHKVSIVDDVENEIEDRGESREVILSAGGNSPPSCLYWPKQCSWNRPVMVA